MNEPESTTHRPRVVLVVDDEVVIREIATTILSRAGYTVLCAEDGRRGLDVFDAHPDEIDVVVLDESMPVLDGLATMLELRQRRSDVPVILSSGHFDAESRLPAVPGPAPLVLRKPYRANGMLEVVRAALRDSGADGSGPAEPPRAP